MRWFLTLAVLLGLDAAPASGQVAFHVLYGVERNVDSGGAENDGWMTLGAEWALTPGVRIGVGTDHQFETATPSRSDYESLALFLSSSVEFSQRNVRPYVRGGVGLGRAPCEGDTCSSGTYLRASTGLRLRLSRAFWLTTEVGLSRVGQPFAGIGLRMVRGAL
ncbi:MAG: hypothetical protein OEO23_13280 [Gemmatimonadota bacterium]|nr:hypothetical protein [Gemmatimonadota bacterium]